MDEDDRADHGLPLDVAAILGDDPEATLRHIVAELHSEPEPDERFVGPLESLLHQGHGELLWPEIERLTRCDRGFRQALRNTWAYDSPEFDRRERLLTEFDSEDGVSDRTPPRR